MRQLLTSSFRLLLPIRFPQKSAAALIPLACVLAIAGRPVDAADTKAPRALWLQFRGPEGNGIASPAEEAPVQWSVDQATWRTELPGKGWSSPIITNDQIIVTAAVPREGDAEDLELSVIWVNRATGKIDLVKPVFQQALADSPGIHQKNSHASPTPLLQDGKLFVHFGHQGTAALTEQGDLLWENRDLTFPPVHGNGGSAVLVDGRLIFTCDGAEEPYIAALESDTGKLAWKTPRPVDAPRKFSFATPTVIEVAGQTQVICPGSDCVLALDPKDGTIIWQVLYDGYSVVPKPVYADGLVFVCTGFGPTQVMAIDPTGKGDVTESHVRWTLDRGAPKTPSLIADQGLLYVNSDDGILTVLETETGDSVYRQRLGGNYSASPILVGDKLYVSSEEGTVRVLKAGEEFEVVAENEFPERILASPAAVDGSLYIRTESALYRIN